MGLFALFDRFVMQREVEFGLAYAAKFGSIRSATTALAKDFPQLFVDLNESTVRRWKACRSKENSPDSCKKVACPMC